MSSDSSNGATSSEEGRPTEVGQSGQRTNFSGTFDSGFSSYLQTPDVLDPVITSPFAHSNLAISSKALHSSNSVPFSSNTSSKALHEDEPLDLTDKPRRRLKFEDEDINNNAVSVGLESVKIAGIESESFEIGNALSTSELPEEVSVDAKKRSSRNVNKRRLEDYLEKEERVMLSSHATKVLLDWYNAHIYKPYACHAELVVISEEAGIEVTQARKWLSNKRARSGNTLSKNGQMHPRKVAKIQEILQVVELPKRQSRTGMDIFTSPSGPPKDTVASPTEPKEEHAPADERESKKLTSSQRDQLEAWFMENIHEPEGPYPDAIKKRELAVRLGLDHAKVVNWFCNKRSRIMPKCKTSKPTATVTAVSQEIIDNPSRSLVHAGVRTSEEAMDLRRNEDVKPHNTVHNAFLESYFRAGMSMMPPGWGNYYGNMSLAQPRPQFTAEGLLPFSPFRFGGTNVGSNPWMQAPGAAVPMINPYTGQSMVCNGAGGMPLNLPAMIPFFPWQFPSTILPVPPLLASEEEGHIGLASRRIQSLTAPVTGEARGTGGIAMHGYSPFINGPQFAPPSFADYLAFQRSMLGGTVTAPSYPVI